MDSFFSPFTNGLEWPQQFRYLTEVSAFLSQLEWEGQFLSIHETIELATVLSLRTWSSFSSRICIPTYFDKHFHFKIFTRKITKIGNTIKIVKLQRLRKNYENSKHWKNREITTVEKKLRKFKNTKKKSWKHNGSREKTLKKIMKTRRFHEKNSTKKVGSTNKKSVRQFFGRKSWKLGQWSKSNLWNCSTGKIRKMQPVQVSSPTSSSSISSSLSQ